MQCRFQYTVAHHETTGNWKTQETVQGEPGKTGAYALAFATIVVWSSTFISTKVLSGHFYAHRNFVVPILLAYVLMFALYPRIHRPESLKSELNLVLAGLSGGSVYFLAENLPSSIRSHRMSLC